MHQEGPLDPSPKRWFTAVLDGVVPPGFERPANRLFLRTVVSRDAPSEPRDAEIVRTGLSIRTRTAQYEPMGRLLIAILVAAVALGTTVSASAATPQAPGASCEARDDAWGNAIIPHYKAALAAAKKLQRLILANASANERLKAQLAQWRGFARMGQASQRTPACSRRVHSLRLLAIEMGGRATQLLSGHQAFAAGRLSAATWTKLAIRLSAEISSRAERFNRIIAQMNP